MKNNTTSLKSSSKKSAENGKAMDEPILGISKSKVVTEAELWSKRAKAYEYIF